MSVLGLDIGGANLKAADTDGKSVEVPFAIWKNPDRLTRELQSLFRQFTGSQCIAVTMTAELADCYQTKAEGVRHIVKSVLQAADLTPVHVWSVSGEFFSRDRIERNDAEISTLAASNWHALATWLSQQFQDRDILLMDIGSTTTDLIPLGRGNVYARGRTDFERLLAGELVYTGIRRTPVCAVTPHFIIQSQTCPISSELFSTTLDVYLLTGDTPEAPGDLETANGRAATRDAAWDRLVRQACCDRTEISWNDALLIAEHVARAQELQIATAVRQVLRSLPDGVNFQEIVLSGSGRFVALRVLGHLSELRDKPVVDVSSLLSPALPEAACAYAVAQLAKAWKRDAL